MRVDALVAALIVDPDLAALPDGLGDLGQVRHLLTGLEPARSVQMEPLEQAGGAPAQLRGERRKDLEPRGRDHRPETELRSGSRDPGQEQRIGLVRGHPGEPRPVALDEPDASVRAALRVDRHARDGERLDVSMDRPDRHLELPRELGGGHHAPCLEQEQQADQAGGAHGTDDT